MFQRRKSDFEPQEYTFLSQWGDLFVLEKSEVEAVPKREGFTKKAFF